MSNPAVIELINTCIGPTTLRVEDNLGEAIHIHMNEYRLDLTISEFEAMADALLTSVTHLVGVAKFDAREYDPSFLAAIGPAILKLERVEIRDVKLDKLMVYAEGVLGVMRCVPLANSRVVKALSGDFAELDRYQQRNPPFVSNRARLKMLEERLGVEGFNPEKGSIVLCNDQLLIRDGQHRAAWLWTRDRCASIPARILVFRFGICSVTERPLFLEIARSSYSKVSQIGRFVLRRIRGFSRALGRYPLRWFRLG